ncbi:ABC transporter ATP-binding protein [Anaerococcus sp. AGMB09787]|uniref:ATP-binding cassette domain-containing protein n=1 Tax=Anaerococcus sp. AGMB09787 TaxID=2922869 RepID=UPI001FAFA4FB
MVENIILLTFAILALLSQRLSLSLVVILAALILVNFPKLFKGYLSKYRKIQTENLSKFNNFISNSLGGFATIKDFSAEAAFLKDIGKYGKEFEKSMVSSKLSINLANNIQYGFSFLIQIMIILLAGVLIHLGYLEIGSILIVGQLLSFVSEPIEEIVNAKNEDLANDLIIKNLGEVENKVEADGTIDKNSLEEKIELKNISLNFSSKQIFDKVNLTLVKGKKYALMGKSGSGKSTLFKLIKGEIKVDKGKVLIDGVDINDITRESKKNIFQAIGQDTFLFNGTIRHNIFLYDNFSEDKYREILQRVNMRATIEALAEKDMTIIGEKSQDLSGGQRQRIQVARGLIRDKDVYLFDEVTANLDEGNANLLEDTIKNLDKTVIAIRHRIDPSLRNYDYIIYLDKKKLEFMDYQDFIDKYQ